MQLPKKRRPTWLRGHWIEDEQRNGDMTGHIEPHRSIRDGKHETAFSPERVAGLTTYERVVRNHENDSLHRFFLETPFLFCFGVIRPTRSSPAHVHCTYQPARSPRRLRTPLLREVAVPSVHLAVPCSRSISITR